MKMLKLLTTASLVLAFAGMASAQTVIRITGSTAYRGQTHKAIIHILGGTFAGTVASMPAGATLGYVGTDFTAAAAAIFTGTVNGNAVIIKTSWSGSVGGVQTVSNGLPVKFIPTATFASGAGTANVPNPQTSSNSSEIESSVPDVAMSDTFQSSTPFTATLLKDAKVGIVPFRFVASKGAPAGLTNITPQLAQALWSAGSMSLALFTGSNGDEGTLVYATGRDPDSGTRLTAFAETGVGVNASVYQYKPTIVSGTVSSYSPYPEKPINGITYDEGMGGESSGGTLATNMAAATNATVGYSITYLSTGDATTALNGGAKELSYNGTTLEAAAPYTSLLEGKYTFWGYEHLMYPNSWVSSVDPTIVIKRNTADALATKIKTVDAAILLDSAVRVSRPTDGGVITQTY